MDVPFVAVVEFPPETWVVFVVVVEFTTDSVLFITGVAKASAAVPVVVGAAPPSRGIV